MSATSKVRLSSNTPGGLVVGDGANPQYHGQARYMGLIPFLWPTAVSWQSSQFLGQSGETLAFITSVVILSFCRVFW
ncbi:hypothetical protein O9992_15020 [Vibrio lentus]|nr:hypothetical protein [Vibrio lentus]